MVKNFGKIIVWCIILAVVLTLALGVVGPILSNISISRHGKLPASSITIEHGLKDMSMLNTAEYYYTHAAKFDDAMFVSFKSYDIQVPFTYKKAIYTCEGFIKAGIDFAKIDVKKLGNRITIMLPLPEITSSEIRHDSFKLFDEQSSVFNPIKVEDVNNSFVDIKKDEEAKAIETGLYTRAIDNAKMIIESFIRSSFDYQEWEIEFKETEPEPTPESIEVSVA